MQLYFLNIRLVHKTLYVTFLDFGLLNELCERVLDEFLFEQKCAQIIVMFSLNVNKQCGIVIQIKTQQTISHIGYQEQL